MIKSLADIFKKAYNIKLENNQIVVLHNRDDKLVLEIMENSCSGIYPLKIPKYEVIGYKEFEKDIDALIFDTDGCMYFAYDTWDGYQPYSN